MKKCDGIKNIIFDVGNVLVDFRYRDYMKELGFSDSLCKEIEDNIVTNELWNEFDKGVMSDEEFFGLIRQQLPERKDEVQLFFDKIEGICAPFDYVEDWLSSIKAAGYKIYILSNYPVSVWEKHEKTIFKFMPYIDGKIVSGYEKLIKPDPAIYKLLFERYNLDPKECIFFDDRIKNVMAARELGVRAIEFTDYETHRRMLDNGLY